MHLPVDDPELQVEPLFAEDLMLLVHSRHPSRRQRVGPLQELAKNRCCSRRGAPRCGASSTALPRRVDVELQAQAEIDGVRLLTSLAFEGYGAGDRAGDSRAPVAEGRLQPHAGPRAPRRVVGWVQRRRPAPGAPTRVLLAVLRDVIALQARSNPACTSVPTPSPSVAPSR